MSFTLSATSSIPARVISTGGSGPAAAAAKPAPTSALTSSIRATPVSSAGGSASGPVRKSSEIMQELIRTKYEGNHVFSALFDFPSSLLPKIRATPLKVLPSRRSTTRELFSSINTATLGQLLEIESEDLTIRKGVRSGVLARHLMRAHTLLGNARDPAQQITAHRSLGHMVFYLQLLTYWSGSSLAIRPYMKTTQYQFGTGGSPGKVAAHHAFIPQIGDSLDEHALVAILKNFYTDWNYCKSESSKSAFLNGKIDLLLWLTTLGIDPESVIDHLESSTSATKYVESIPFEPHNLGCFSIRSRLGILSNMTLVTDREVNLVDDYLETEMRRSCIDLLQDVATTTLDPDVAMADYLGWFGDACVKIKGLLEPTIEFEAYFSSFYKSYSRAAASFTATPAEAAQVHTEMSALFVDWLVKSEEMKSRLEEIISLSMNHESCRGDEPAFPQLRALCNQISELNEKITQILPSPSAISSTTASADFEGEMVELKQLQTQIKRLPIKATCALANRTMEILNLQEASLGPTQDMLLDFKRTVPPALYNQVRQIQGLFFMAHNIDFN